MTPQNASGRIVLAGFLGAGKYSDKSYLFSEDRKPEDARLFPLALQRFMASEGRKPNLWLVMGTESSVWSVLEDAVPEDARTQEFKTLSLRVEEAVVNKRADQKLLDEWGTELGEASGQPTRCFLAGDARQTEAQHDIWRALDQSVEIGDEVVFDITYGLRHQPVVASYSLMLLRWTKNVSIEICYGAAELQGTAPCCPVVFLPFCQQLVQASEAVATWDATGDYQLLGKEMDLSPAFEKRLEKVAYADELNHPLEHQAAKLREELERTIHLRPPAPSLEGRLLDSLKWAAEKEQDYRYARKAVLAFERRQFFKAIAYLYEAVLMANMLNQNNTRVESARSREDSKGQLDQRDYHPNQHNHDSFLLLSYLRNAVLHGTNATNWRLKGQIEDALHNEEKLKEIFWSGHDLWKQIARAEENPMDPG